MSVLLRFLPVLVVLTWLTPLQADAAGSTACANAKALLDKGFLAAAEKIYKKIQEEQECASAGLLAVLEKRCDIAKKKLTDDESQQARQIYESLLQENPTLPCATEGLNAIKAHQVGQPGKDIKAISPPPPTCAQARSKFHEGNLKGAHDTYSGILQAKPDSTCAAAGIQAINNCQRGNTLRQLDQWASAREAYEELLKLDPEAPCATRGLEAVERRSRLLHETTSSGIWTSIKSTWNDVKYLDEKYFTPYILEPVTALLSGVAWLFALLTLVALLRTDVRQWSMSRLSKLFALRLDIDEFKLDILPTDKAKALNVELLAQLEAELFQLAQPTVVRQTLQVVDGFIATPSLPKLSTLPEEANNLWKFISDLLPKRNITLSGVLRKDPQKGLGLQVRLFRESTKELWGSTIIWQKDLDPEWENSKSQENTGSVPQQDGDSLQQFSECYSALAMAAAVWALWTVHEKERHEEKACVRAKCQMLREAYGTDSWRSHVSVQMGRRLMGKERDNGPEAKISVTRAERFFHRALDRDPENWQALLLLADAMLNRILEDATKRKAPASYEQVLEYIAAAEKWWQPDSRKADRKKREDTIPILALLKRGEIALYCYLLAGRTTAKLEMAEQALRDASNKAQESSQFTDVALRTIKAAHAVSLRIKAGHRAAEHQLNELVKPGWIPTSVRYNLACYYSSPDGEQEPSEKDLQTADEHLVATCELNERYAQLAGADPTLDQLRAWRNAQGKPPLGKAA